MLEMNKIYCMDCLEGLKEIPDNSIDLIITSPPYNQNLTTQNTSMKLYEDNKSDEEYTEWIKKIFTEMYRILKINGSLFYNYKTDVFENRLKPAFEHLIKVKGSFLISAEIIWKYAGNFDSARCRFPTDYEMIYHLTKTNNYFFNPGNESLSSVWVINHVMANTNEKKSCGCHPCPYPLKLMRKIIKHCSRERER